MAARIEFGPVSTSSPQPTTLEGGCCYALEAIKPKLVRPYSSLGSIEPEGFYLQGTPFPFGIPRSVSRPERSHSLRDAVRSHPPMGSRPTPNPFVSTRVEFCNTQFIPLQGRNHCSCPGLHSTFNITRYRRKCNLWYISLVYFKIPFLNR